MDLTSGRPFTHHPVMENTTPTPGFWPTVYKLFFSPARLVSDIQTGVLHTQALMLYSAVFLLLESLFFATTTILHRPTGVTWTLLETELRFGFMFLGFLLIGFPLLTTLWAALQKFSSWYWEARLTLREVLGLVGLGLGYYVLMFLLSIPIMLIPGLSGYSIEVILFTLNISAFMLSLRLFYSAYRTVSQFSIGKSLFVTLFPLLLIGLVYSATQLLTMLAMIPHLRGH